MCSSSPEPARLTFAPTSHLGQHVSGSNGDGLHDGDERCTHSGAQCQAGISLCAWQTAIGQKTR